MVAPQRIRPIAIRVMVTAQEQAELQKCGKIDASDAASERLCAIDGARLRAQRHAPLSCETRDTTMPEAEFARSNGNSSDPRLSAPSPRGRRVRFRNRRRCCGSE